MRRSSMAYLLALPLAAIMAMPAAADVRTREKTLVKIEGILGGAFRLFGGKSAREGIVSTTVVKGNRKATIGENSSQVIDLGEEKIYDVDLKKKEYKVTTFADLRRQMEEEKARAEKEAEKEAEREKKAEKRDPQKEYEVDFDVKETGQKKQLAGYDTREVVMTVTLREKGMKLEDSGGFVMTSNSWLGPQIASLKELTDFDMRYWKQLYGAEATALSAQQMAAVMAMYPALKQASERLSKEGSKLQGTPLATTTVFEVVKSKAQMAQTESSGGGGGLGGMLARKMKKDDPKPRSTIFTIEHEFQEVSTSVAATDLEIPAGFKEKK